MLKHKWVILIAGCTTFISTAFAQQNLFLGTPPDTSQNRAGTGAGKIESPTEFSKNIAKINAQQKAEFQQQFNQQLTQIPKTPIPAAPVAQPIPSQTPGAPPTNPMTTSPQQSITASPNTQYQPPTSTMAPNTAASPTRLPSAPTPPTTTQPIYTGFPTAPSQPAQSGGQTKSAPSNWNIKY